MQKQESFVLVKADFPHSTLVSDTPFTRVSKSVLIIMLLQGLGDISCSALHPFWAVRIRFTHAAFQQSMLNPVDTCYLPEQKNRFRSVISHCKILTASFPADFRYQSLVHLFLLEPVNAPRASPSLPDG